MLLLFVWAILSVDWRLFPDKFSLDISYICCFPVFLKIAKIIDKNRNHDNRPIISMDFLFISAYNPADRQLSWVAALSLISACLHVMWCTCLPDGILPEMSRSLCSPSICLVTPLYTVPRWRLIPFEFCRHVQPTTLSVFSLDVLHYFPSFIYPQQDICFLYS